MFSTLNSRYPLFFRASGGKLLNVKVYSTQREISGQAQSCSKILNGKNTYNTVPNFKGNSVFQGKRELLNNPEC